MKSVFKFGLILAVFLVGLFVAGIAAAQDEHDSDAVDSTQTDCGLEQVLEVSTMCVGEKCPAPFCDKPSQGCLLTGESVQLCGPEGKYNYQWGKFIGKNYKQDGTSQCMVLTVPYGTWEGTSIGAILTVTTDNYLACQDKTCIKYTVCKTPCCPNLDNFCEGEATGANAAKFIYAGLPDGYTYEWWINGAKVENPDEAYLDGLKNGWYSAVIKIYHGEMFVKNVCYQWFFVSENPVATITPSPLGTN